MQFYHKANIVKSTTRLRFIWFEQPRLVVHGLGSPEPLKSPRALRSRSECFHCPSMMDDAVYRSSIPLALLPLIGLKAGPLGLNRRGHWPRLCLNYFIVPSLAVACQAKTEARQDGPKASGIDLTWGLCLTVWPSLENGALKQLDKKKKKK